MEYKSEFKNELIGKVILIPSFEEQRDIDKSRVESIKEYYKESLEKINIKDYLWIVQL